MDLAVVQQVELLHKMLSSDLINKRNKYIALKNNVKNLLKNLTIGNIYLENANNSITTCYLFDGKVADGETVNKLYNEMSSITDKLSNIVLPQIDAKISSLLRSISSALKEEAYMRDSNKLRKARDNNELY